MTESQTMKAELALETLRELPNIEALASLRQWLKSCGHPETLERLATSALDSIQLRISHLVRKELMALLRTLAADDRRWRRRAQILSASYGVGAHEHIAELLEVCTDVGNASCFLQSAGASAEYGGEGPLLRWIEALPEIVIPILRAKGGKNIGAGPSSDRRRPEHLPLHAQVRLGCAPEHVHRA